MIQNVIKKLFSVQGGKVQTIYRIFGIKFRRRKYTYMLRKLYQWKNFERQERIFAAQGIRLPPEAELLLEDVEFTTVLLKDIRREWRGKPYSLDEVSPYKYLQTRDKRIYADYIQKHIDLGVSSPDADKSPTRFEALEKSIDENGYDPSKSVIVLDKTSTVSTAHAFYIINTAEITRLRSFAKNRVKIGCFSRLNGVNRLRQGSTPLEVEQT